MMYLNQPIKHTKTSYGLITDSVIDHITNVSKSDPLVGSSYMRLGKELGHPKKDLINIQNIDDNECFMVFSLSFTS